MDSKISEELNTFLEEVKTSPEAEKTIQKEKGESLEKLLEDIIGSTQAEVPPVDLKEKSLSKVFEKEKRHFKSPRLPLILSIAFLGGCFLGTIFGFYWGNSKRPASLSPSFEEMDAKITQLVHQIQEIYEKITPVTPPGEVIEPFSPPTDLDKLVPRGKL